MQFQFVQPVNTDLQFTFGNNNLNIQSQKQIILLGLPQENLKVKIEQQNVIQQQKELQKVIQQKVIQQQDIQQQKEKDEKYINIYKQRVHDEKLIIYNNQIKDLSFIDNLNVQKLELQTLINSFFAGGFYSVVPEFTSKTLKELKINNVDKIENFKNILLENLEILKISNCETLKDCEYLTQVKILELCKVKNIQELFTNKICKNIQELRIKGGNVTNLDTLQIENVRILRLINSQAEMQKLNIQNITTYKYLRELHLQGYDDLDTTHLQYLNNLNIVQLEKCNNITINFNSQNIKDLMLNCCILKSLESFQLPNLQNLGITDFSSVNLDNINQFKNLRELNLQDNKEINSLSQLQDLQLQITSLNLSRCKLMDMQSIDPVDVQKDQYIDVSPLKFLVKLEKLYLNNCKLNDINMLSFLHNLNELDLSYNDITDLTPLQTLVQLKMLKLENCNLTNIDSLDSLVNLEELNLSNQQNFKKQETYSFDTAPLKYLVKLNILNLNKCRKLNCLNTNQGGFEELQYLNSLTKLDLSKCELLKVDVLKSLTNLKILELNENRKIDITPIQYLTQLITLDLDSCGLHSVEALIPLRNLKNLYLSFNSIVYIQPLKQLKLLVQLSFLGGRAIDLDSYFTRFFDFDSFFGKQTQPEAEEIQQANLSRDINSPVTQLNNLYKKRQVLQNAIYVGKSAINSFLNQQVINSLQVTKKVVQLFTQHNGDNQ
ncbi:leucine-rich_repeat protein [Hexamita inflata]|uniref:Putative n=1 Tax=Hexamita inflata TaxID=28002 RepID=A0AA86V5I4_9EUKA|nr:leucine-rich repeat protein [Hexamita inflata]